MPRMPTTRAHLRVYLDIQLLYKGRLIYIYMKTGLSHCGVEELSASQLSAKSGKLILKNIKKTRNLRKTTKKNVHLKGEMEAVLPVLSVIYRNVFLSNIIVK